MDIVTAPRWRRPARACALLCCPHLHRLAHAAALSSELARNAALPREGGHLGDPPPPRPDAELAAYLGRTLRAQGAMVR